MERLLWVLESIELKLTADELADVLWLAILLEPISSDPSQLQASSEKRNARESDSNSVLSQKTQAEADKKNAAGIHAQKISSDEGSKTKIGGFPFQSPSASALPGGLEIGKAIRPLKQHAPSRSAFVLDEEATIRRIDAEKLLIPVLRPVSERWLDIVLIIDQSPSMVLWNKTISEFRHLLEYQGIFRNIWEWSVKTYPDGRNEFYTGVGNSKNRKHRNPMELIDSSGRRLFLIVSDCVSDMWLTSSMGKILANLGQHNPLAILQMLPPNLWPRTALGSLTPAFLGSPISNSENAHGVPNNYLRTELTRDGFRIKRPPAGSFPIPVISLLPDLIKPWAQVVVGQERARIPGYFFPTRLLNQTGVEDGAITHIEQPTSLEYYQIFKANASPEAWQLAIYFAASPVLTLPIMRLIQHAMLPKSRQTHLAEVFLSGLLKKQDSISLYFDPEQVEYHFDEELQNLLLDQSLVSQAGQVLIEVSNFIEKRFEQIEGFQTILSSTETFSSFNGISLRPFAHLDANVLKRIEQRYAQYTHSSESQDIARERQKTEVAKVSNVRKRIFLSYERGVQPDETLALTLYEAFSQAHDVFIDQIMPIGTNWLESIQHDLESCDFIVPLLSFISAHSEMVEYEISKAYQFGKAHGGKPYILPVRVAFTEPLDYPLNAYLNPLYWATWKDESDTPSLIAELRTAFADGQLNLANLREKQVLAQTQKVENLHLPTPSANISELELPVGTMDVESRFYLERPSDVICQREVARGGTTLVIKAPRQMGKSSLLVRAAAQARRLGRKVAFLDFQLLDEEMLKDPQRFFQGFCRWIADEFDIDASVDEAWQSGLGHTQSCTKYVRRHALKGQTSPVTLVMDEVDRMLGCPFRSDFFGMLRSWHNNRAIGPEWRKLDLLLVISTEPYLLIDDLKQSPFNVGEVIRLDDFSLAQTIELNVRHGNPFNSVQIQRLYSLLGGHPYLTRQALYLVTVKKISPDSLFTQAVDESGPFGDHLRRHLFRFSEHPELVQAMGDIIKHQTCRDELLFNRLHGAGLVMRQGGNIRPRCELYAAYFQKRLNNV